MKKLLTLGALFFAASLTLASCKGNKAQKDSIADDTLQTEELGIEAITPSDSVFAATVAFFQEDNKGNGLDSTYVETPSGLKYRILKEGNGIQPKAEDSVTVHYEGRLLNGTKFDSSYDRGEPATFPLNAVIKGWTEGLQTMKEGGITEFYIPAAIAYGETGTPGGPIPPNAPLIFKVELIKVN